MISFTYSVRKPLEISAMEFFYSLDVLPANQPTSFLRPPQSTPSSVTLEFKDFQGLDFAAFKFKYNQGLKEVACSHQNHDGTGTAAFLQALQWQ